MVDKWTSHQKTQPVPMCSATSDACMNVHPGTKPFKRITPKINSELTLDRQTTQRKKPLPPVID